MNTPVLSEDELGHFTKRGFVRVTDALPVATVTRVQDYVWNEYKTYCNVVREDPSTYAQADWIGINKKAIDKAAGTEIGPRLVGAVNQLLGEGQWKPLNTLGGLLLTPPRIKPETWNTGSFHFDNGPHAHLGGVNELMLFTFYSSVGPRGGGTLALSGSTVLIDDYISAQNAKQKEGKVSEQKSWISDLLDTHPWLAELMEKQKDGRSIVELVELVMNATASSVQIAELTGEPGDAVLCHPALLHAVSENCSPTFRIMRRTNFRRKK